MHNRATHKSDFSATVISLLILTCNLVSCRNLVISPSKDAKIRKTVTFRSAPYSGGRYTTKCIDTFDKNGLLLSSRSYDVASNSILGTTTYTYNKIGNKVSEIIHDHDGNVVQSVSFQCNTRHQVISSVEQLSDTTWNIKHYYLYDENGNVIEDKLIQRSIEKRTVYKFDSNSNKLMEANYFSGKFSSGYIYKYDDSSILIETKYVNERHDTFNEINTPRSVKYTRTDQSGNWLMKVEKNYILPSVFSKREITYY